MLLFVLDHRTPQIFWVSGFLQNISQRVLGHPKSFS
jgi:hypothetical protein